MIEKNLISICLYGFPIFRFVSFRWTVQVEEIRNLQIHALVRNFADLEIRIARANSTVGNEKIVRWFIAYRSCVNNTRKSHVNARLRLPLEGLLHSCRYRAPRPTARRSIVFSCCTVFSWENALLVGAEYSPSFRAISDDDREKLLKGMQESNILLLRSCMTIDSRRGKRCKRAKSNSSKLYTAILHRSTSFIKISRSILCRGYLLLLYDHYIYIYIVVISPLCYNLERANSPSSIHVKYCIFAKTERL